MFFLSVKVSVESNRDKFVHLLKEIGIVPDDKVMSYIATNVSMSNCLGNIITPEEAGKFYSDAELIPQSETRAEVLRECNIKIEGEIYIPGAQNARFLHAFESNVPKVLKIPALQSKAEIECALYAELSLKEAKEYALVPVRYLTLKGTYSKKFSPIKILKAGILMPHYCCTLSEIPPPFSTDFCNQIYRRLEKALDFLASNKWKHGGYNYI